MSAHHAPRRVTLTAEIVGNVTAVAGILLLLGWFAGMIAFGAKQEGLLFLAWGKGHGFLGKTVYSPPLGEGLAGLALVILGPIMCKTSRRFNRSDYDIPWIAAVGTQKRARAMARIKEVRRQLAYPQRRIGRRLIGLGIPAVLSSALMVWSYSHAAGQLHDDGAQVMFGAKFGMWVGLVAFAGSLAALICGIVFFGSAPSKEESNVAAAEELRPPPPAFPSMPPIPDVPVPPMPTRAGDPAGGSS